MVSAKAAEQVTAERGAQPPVAANGHPGAAEAMEQGAREHVWIHQLPWAEFESDNLRVFDRGDGARLYDVRGREYIDGISGLWVVNAGHGRREIAQSYADQAARLGYASAMTYTTTPAVKLAEKLAEITPGISRASSSSPAARKRSRRPSRSPSRSRPCAASPAATRSSPAAAPTTA